MPETVPDASHAPPDGRFFHPDPVENARKDVFSVPDSTKSKISRFILSSSGLRRPETGFPKPAASTGCLWKPARSLPRGIERPDRTSACGCLWRISGKNARFSHAFPYPFPEMFSTPPFFPVLRTVASPGERSCTGTASDSAPPAAPLESSSNPPSRFRTFPKNAQPLLPLLLFLSSLIFSLFTRAGERGQRTGIADAAEDGSLK